MKTINRKAMVSILGSFISLAAMAQVNLGLSSTTQAALNIATSTATISQVTGKVVNTVSARANDLQAKTFYATKKLVSKTSSTLKQTTDEVSNSADLGASTSMNLQNTAGLSGSAANEGSSTTGSVNSTATVDASGLTNSTKENARKTLPATRQQVKTAVAQTKELKNNIQDDLQSNTPATTVTGNASSSTQVSANKK